MLLTGSSTHVLEEDFWRGRGRRTQVFQLQGEHVHFQQNRFFELAVLLPFPTQFLPDRVEAIPDPTPLAQLPDQPLQVFYLPLQRRHLNVRLRVERGNRD